MALRITTRPLGAKAGYGLGCGMILLILLVTAIIGSFLWPYSINSWLIYLGKAPKVTWGQGFLIGAIPYFGGLSVPIAFGTWILMLILM